ncbi:pilus assembly protein N-terminal domain-containing protein [Bradyrhizobium jicamae]|uniref:Pilus assembly protein N-terminal domain-containing protein n=1 Tax=Bradyrhizobium jicamae TaxID=280332 RepID=A0ABS5FY50_9BRAD|nr:pilus assembly protein N-terminal domain-containing protein [Bradyrhizobium jicamae]MBR0801757.1 pilus assembly protein N-terminal domain-containing protein [Bradyrhizobium jicamae]
MKSLVVACTTAIAVMIFAGVSVFAQDNQSTLKEITAADTVSLYIGQSKAFSFDDPVTEIKLTGSGVAKVVPLNDHTVSIEGLKAGEVMAFVYGANGHAMHNISIEVGGPSYGRPVRIYGNSETEKGAAYSLYYCSGKGCGRPNPDVEHGPSEVSVSETKPAAEGGSTMVEKTYR